MKSIILAPLVFLISVASLGSATTGQSLSDKLAAFEFEGNLRRQVAEAFIEEVRGRLDKPSLSMLRIKELILYSEIATKMVSEQVKEARWYTGYSVSVQEILESIATANMFQNIHAQQSWEGAPNLGYMDIRATTALNALWDMDIHKLHHMNVPWTLEAYKKNEKFQKWFTDLLISDPYINILLGTWTFCKVKNQAEGSFQGTIARYTMGSASHRKKLKEDPKSQGLADIAWGHWNRWKKWHLVWKQGAKLVKKSLE